MIDTLEFFLYRDPQQEPPGDFCPICGGERYLPGLHCARCQRWEL